MTALTYIQSPTVERRAVELRALAGYAHRGDIDQDVAFGIAERNWIAATLPTPMLAWNDYVRAVGLLHDLDAGLIGWADVEPGLTGLNRHAVALDLARQQVAACLFPLLYGPEAKPCRRCQRGHWDVWRPAVIGGVCVQCQGIEWIGGRP